MSRVCKSFVPALLLILSACGTPERPKPSAVQPPVEPAAPIVKEDAKPAQVKDDTPKKVLPKQPWHYNYALAANGAKASGCDKSELLIDGNSTVYDGGEG